MKKSIGIAALTGGSIAIIYVIYKIKYRPQNKTLFEKKEHKIVSKTNITREESQDEINFVHRDQPIITEPMSNITNSTYYQRLGISIVTPTGWSSKQEVSPHPIISMISISLDKHANETPSIMNYGTIPIVILSIEDNQTEGYTIDEYMKNAKEMSFMQMYQMTQGQFRPEIVFEGKKQIGSFDLSFEFIQQQQPFLMHIRNHVTMKNGVIYTLQMMCKPDIFSTYLEDFDLICKGIIIEPLQSSTAFSKKSYIKVSSGSIEAKIPTSWRIQNVEAMLFHTGSMSKTDSIQLLRSNEDIVLDLLNDGEIIEEKKIENCTCSHIKVNTKIKKLFTLANFSLIIEPIKENKCTVDDSYCVEVLLNTSESTDLPQILYESKEKKCTFPLKSAKSGIVEARLGDGSIQYFPTYPSNQLEMSNDISVITLRVENPSTDPDCMASIDEWYSRIKNESTTDSTLSEIKRENINGYAVVRFVSKDMVEVMPGTKEERCASIVIFVHDGMTHMLRCECTSSSFKKSINEFNDLIHKYSFL